MTFYDGIHIFERAQKVMVEVPPTATNVYLTTNNKNPVPSDTCRFTAGVLSIDHPVVVKLRYDLDGITYNQTGIYIIQSAIQESRYGNRVAIDIFERFIRNHINKSFGPTPTYDATETISDGMDGTTTRTTDIEGFIFVKGRQTFTFDKYKYFDKDNNTYFVANSGRIFGFRDRNGGYYNTDVDGQTIVFSGTFNGNADGHFYLNTESQTTGGFYRVACTDRWCANGDVIYALDSFREFVEIYPRPEDKPKSCD